MNVLNKAKIKLAKMLNISFGVVETDKEPLHFDGEELEAGMAVFYLDESGNMETPIDGDYVLPDGRVAQVADGVVAEIIDGEGEAAETQAMENEKKPEQQTGEVGEEDFNELVEIVNNLVDEVNEIKEELETAQESYKKTKRELAQVKADFANATRTKGKPLDNREPKPQKKQSYISNETANRFFNGWKEE